MRGKDLTNPPTGGTIKASWPGWAWVGDSNPDAYKQYTSKYEELQGYHPSKGDGLFLATPHGYAAHRDGPGCGGHPMQIHPATPCARRNSVRRLAYTGDDQGHRGAMMPGVRPGWSWATTSDRTGTLPLLLGGWGLSILPDRIALRGQNVNAFI